MRFDDRRALTVLAAHEVECIVELKTAAGRPKDLAVLPTLRATLAEIETTRNA